MPPKKKGQKGKGKAKSKYPTDSRFNEKQNFKIAMGVYKYLKNEWDETLNTEDNNIFEERGGELKAEAKRLEAEWKQEKKAYEEKNLKPFQEAAERINQEYQDASNKDKIVVMEKLKPKMREVTDNLVEAKRKVERWQDKNAVERSQTAVRLNELGNQIQYGDGINTLLNQIGPRINLAIQFFTRKIVDENIGKYDWKFDKRGDLVLSDMEKDELNREADEVARNTFGEDEKKSSEFTNYNESLMNLVLSQRIKYDGPSYQLRKADKDKGAVGGQFLQKSGLSNVLDDFITVEEKRDKKLKAEEKEETLQKEDEEMAERLGLTEMIKKGDELQQKQSEALVKTEEKEKAEAEAKALSKAEKNRLKKQRQKENKRLREEEGKQEALSKERVEEMRGGAAEGGGEAEPKKSKAQLKKERREKQEADKKAKEEKKRLQREAQEQKDETLGRALIMEQEYLDETNEDKKIAERIRKETVEEEKRKAAEEKKEEKRKAVEEKKRIEKEQLEIENDDRIAAI